MSGEQADRAQRVAQLLNHADRAVDLAGLAEERASATNAVGSATEAAAVSIALSLSGLIEQTAIDESKSYERMRKRELAFAAELTKLATGRGATLQPDERTQCLTVLAQWISEGYDGPPTVEDYVHSWPPHERRRVQPRLMVLADG